MCIKHNNAQEIFYQIVGEMTVEAIEKGKRKPVTIKEGCIFMLPGTCGA
jgi:hypothetical protein